MWMVFDANTYGGAVKRLHEAMLQQGAALEAIEAYRRRGLSDPVVLERLEKIASEAAERVRQAYCDYQGALSGP
jgi:type II secretory pathway pseudopilin PulG